MKKKLFIGIALVIAICATISFVIFDKYLAPDEIFGVTLGESFNEMKNKYEIRRVNSDVWQIKNPPKANDLFENYLITFDSNNIMDGISAFSKEYDNKELLLSDYNNVKEILINKYGKPTEEKGVFGLYWVNVNNNIETLILNSRNDISVTYILKNKENKVNLKDSL